MEMAGTQQQQERGASSVDQFNGPRVCDALGGLAIDLHYVNSHLEGQTNCWKSFYKNQCSYTLYHTQRDILLKHSHSASYNNHSWEIRMFFCTRL